MYRAMTIVLLERRRAAEPVDVRAMKAAVKRELNLESTLEPLGVVYPEIGTDPTSPATRIVRRCGGEGGEEPRRGVRVRRSGGRRHEIVPHPERCGRTALD
jgi:hypothetical protein